MTADESQSDRPLVDVCVVSWNTAELTADALRRLLDSDQGCDLRLLVRDNASTDGTPEILKERVPEAEVDTGSENLGFARGVNTLLARSTAPWILLLNSDAWPEPGAIGRLIDVARAHPRAAAVAPRLERPDGTLDHSTYPFPSLRIAAIMAFWRRRLSHERAEELMLEGDWGHDQPRRVDWAVGAALLVRREAVLDVGGLDEQFFMYAEDLEWCWRASRKGWEIWFEPSALVRHVGNASGAKRYGDLRTKTYMVNTYRFFEVEHGKAAALAYRGLNLVASGLRYIAARRAGDTELANYWRMHVAANLARKTKPPTPK
jgi:N-acetylglucosaminyl-diphospho-decaprenol L-rhamnosyltransferase